MALGSAVLVRVGVTVALVAGSGVLVRVGMSVAVGVGVLVAVLVGGTGVLVDTSVAVDGTGVLVASSVLPVASRPTPSALSCVFGFVVKVEVRNWIPLGVSKKATVFVKIYSYCNTLSLHSFYFCLTGEIVVGHRSI